ncbi:MAG TPA: carbon-phosphorus lyase complex subunit PhnI [Candidatus Elarobacter sp.]|nr:carbon-phosphorus lyase complex subunit PhnI [Candidatus Elarobacter sp.]
MTYVAVKGGERAIAAAETHLAALRRGDPSVTELVPRQIDEQLRFAVDRVLAEGGLYDRDAAALAVKQALGDLVEAVFLMRAYRATVPRIADALPLDTAHIEPSRRVSATYKDLPGGQVIGPSFDYTHRLLDAELASTGGRTPRAPERDPERDVPPHIPHATITLEREGLLRAEVATHDVPPADITRAPLQTPAERSTRLQVLARADEGFVLGLAYSTQRGYGRNHPFAADVRVGEVEVEVVPDELGFPVVIGVLTVTEVQMVNQFGGSAGEPPQFTRGYGLVFGYNERKAMAMALVDRALRATELGERVIGPAQNEEFVLMHGDSVEAQGFVQHLKLPHYVDFQAETELVRRLRAERSA